MMQRARRIGFGLFTTLAIVGLAGQAPAADERLEVSGIKAVRATLVDTATALQQGNIAKAKEAFEAYDMQDERVRFDTLGRKWTFRPDKDGDHGVLSLILRLGPDARERTILNSLLAADKAHDALKAQIEELDAWE